MSRAQLSLKWAWSSSMELIEAGYSPNSITLAFTRRRSLWRGPSSKPAMSIRPPSHDHCAQCPANPAAVSIQPLMFLRPSCAAKS